MKAHSSCWKQERAKKEREEYEAMKTAFSVEGEGEGEKGLLSTDSEISEFVAHVKVRAACQIFEGLGY